VGRCVLPEPLSRGDEALPGGVDRTCRGAIRGECLCRERWHAGGARAAGHSDSRPGDRGGTRRALPGYRRALAWSVTNKAVGVAAASRSRPYRFRRHPILGILASLVLGIARIHGQRLTLRRSRELVVTFGLGFLGRTLFRSCRSWAGHPDGPWPAAIAASTTVAMGRAAAVWFERGEKATAAELRAESWSLAKQMLQSLAMLGRRRPSRDVMEAEVEATLSEVSPTEPGARGTAP